MQIPVKRNMLQPPKQKPFAEAEAKAAASKCACGCEQKHNNGRLFVVGYPNNIQQRHWVKADRSCDDRLKKKLGENVYKRGVYY